MYERFTDRARKVFQLANQEAQRYNHEYIGTEHILLGLLKEGSGVAAHVLKNLGVELRKIRLEVENRVQSRPDVVCIGKLPQTPRAKKVIDHAMEEARNLNHDCVGTEHILLGLLRENEGLATQILKDFGLTSEKVRDEILAVLSDPVQSGTHEARKTRRSEDQTYQPRQEWTPCGFPGCGTKATFHFTHVEGRKCVWEEHFCRQHARTVLDPYKPRPQEHPRSPITLQDATNYDIDLIVLSETHDQKLIFLREVGGERLIPISVGFFEASSLERKFKGFESTRPLTHDAMAMMVRELGAKVQDVVIDKLEKDTFHAKVRMLQGDDQRIVDIRPSDAFMLAIDFDCPIFFMANVLDVLK